MSTLLSSQHLQELLHEYIEGTGGKVPIEKSLQEDPVYTEEWMIGFARRVEMTVHDTGRARANMFAKRAEASAAEALGAKKDAELARALSLERYLDQSIQRQTIEWVSGTELQVWPVEGVVDPGAKAHLRRRDTDFFVIDDNRDNMTDQTPVTVKFVREDNTGPAFIQFEDINGATWKLDDDPVGPNPEEVEQEDTVPDNGEVFDTTVAEEDDQPQTDEPETVEDGSDQRAAEGEEETPSADSDKPV